MMSSFAGTWQVTHHWDGASPYNFTMTISDAGIINIEGGYTGIISELGNSSFLSLAIGNGSGGSITAYAGNIAGPAMGGTMTGTAQDRVWQGWWVATLESNALAPKKAFEVGK